MTTMMSVNKKCSVCGETSSFSVLGSSNSMGSPDLDLRPAPMYRFTMEMWIHECPECGYVAGDLSEKTKISREWLETEEYRNCDGIRFKYDLAELFYKRYMIYMQEGQKRGAFNSIHHAAWACDDCGDAENAKHCRRLAVRLVDDFIDQEPRERRDTLKLIKLDLMRRAELFEQAHKEYSGTEFEDELLRKILAFELQKIRKEDTGCYRVADVE